MKAIKSFLDFFLFSNLFISFCAAVITIETYLLRFPEEINWVYVSFVFFSTLVFYVLPSLFFAKEAFSAGESVRHKWIFENRKTLVVLLVIGSAGVGASVCFLPLKFIFWLIPSAVIAFAYFIPQTNLRRFIGLKAVLIAFVWTAVTCVYPLLLHSFPETDFRYFFYGYNGLLMAQRFFFLLPFCIIFNVRDMAADKAAGVRTFPLAFGIKAARIICLVSLFIFTVFLRFPFGILENALVVSAVIASLLILRTSKTSSEYFYSFGMDGMILLQFLLVWAAIKL